MTRPSWLSPAALALSLLILPACGGSPPAAALGETVDVEYADSVSGAVTNLSLAVTGVREGTIEELEATGLTFDEEERSLVPRYVDSTVTNTGDAAVTLPRPSLEDGGGNLISATVIFDFSGGEGGGNGPCPDGGSEELAPGATLEDCTLFLVPEGTELGSAQFLVTPAEGEPEFLRWAVE